jgi:hypothetical protein
MLATYPVTSPCSAIPGTLRWYRSRPSRDRSQRNGGQRAHQNTRAKTKCFYLRLFSLNMHQLITVISGSLCSSVRIGTRGGRPRDRRSISSSSSRLLFSNPKPPDKFQGRPDLLFNGHQEIFGGGGVMRALRKTDP